MNLDRRGLDHEQQSPLEHRSLKRQTPQLWLGTTLALLPAPLELLFPMARANEEDARALIRRLGPGLRLLAAGAQGNAADMETLLRRTAAHLETALTLEPAAAVLRAGRAMQSAACEAAFARAGVDRSAVLETFGLLLSELELDGHQGSDDYWDAKANNLRTLHASSCRALSELAGEGDALVVELARELSSLTAPDPAQPAAARARIWAEQLQGWVRRSIAPART